MRRSAFVIVALAVLMHSCGAYAQIEGKKHFDLGDEISFKVPALEGADASCVARRVVQMGDVEVLTTEKANVRLHGTDIFAWTKTGIYVLEYRAAKDSKLIEAEHRFTVGDAPTPAPVPPGPAPIPPGPAPVDPVGPLGQLVSAEARPLLAEFFGDLATVVRQGSFQTTGHFRNGYRKAVADAQGQGSLPIGLAAVDKPVSDRIAGAIGLADVAIDEAKKGALAVCLEQVAADF